MGLCLKYALFTFSFLILVSILKVFASFTTHSVLIMPCNSVELLKENYFRLSFNISDKFNVDTVCFNCLRIRVNAIRVRAQPLKSVCIFR